MNSSGWTPASDLKMYVTGEIWLSASNAQKAFPNDSLAKYFDVRPSRKRHGLILVLLISDMH